MNITQIHTHVHTQTIIAMKGRLIWSYLNWSRKWSWKQTPTEEAHSGTRVRDVRYYKVVKSYCGDMDIKFSTVASCCFWRLILTTFPFSLVIGIIMSCVYTCGWGWERFWRCMCFLNWEMYSCCLWWICTIKSVSVVGRASGGWGGGVALHIHGVRRNQIKKVPDKDGVIVRTADDLEVVKL